MHRRAAASSRWNEKNRSAVELDSARSEKVCRKRLSTDEKVSRILYLWRMLNAHLAYECLV